MKLVTQTDCMAKTYGAEGAVVRLARAGYDALDWSFFELAGPGSIWLQSDWRERAEAIRDLAAQEGVSIVQAHAPFPSSRGLEAYDGMIMERIRRSVEVASIMGVQHIVVHPKHHLPYLSHRGELWQMNVDFFTSLIPLCEEFGIHICAENMWQRDEYRQVIRESICAAPEEFAALLDAVDSPWITGCLDIGHCALVGIDPCHAIRILGPDRIAALHVHDVDYVQDRHMLPFTESLDWISIMGELAGIGFEGNLTFEADQFLAKLPSQLREDGAAFMVKVGRFLIGLFEEHEA